MFSKQVKSIIENADEFHNSFYKTGTFRGPSLYFHLRAIDTRLELNNQHHLEYVYAALSSWGMHRMGPKGSKMVPFETFQKSIFKVRGKISAVQKLSPDHLDTATWFLLKEIFYSIKIMETQIHLVGHSKVMHHMMPNLIPPVDRQYTLRFLQKNTNIQANIVREWAMLEEMLQGFFFPILSDQVFHSKANKWIRNKPEFAWDTSLLKVIDNLIIGSASQK